MTNNTDSSKGGRLGDSEDSKLHSKSKGFKSIPLWSCEWLDCGNKVRYQIDLKIDDIEPWICDEHMSFLVRMLGDKDE